MARKQRDLVKFETQTIYNEQTEQHQEYLVVPLEEAQEYLDKAGEGLAKRIWAKIWPSYKEHKHYGEITTDTGYTAQATLSDSSPANRYYEQMKIDNTRRAQYEDYQRMDRESSELRTALNITVSNVFLPVEAEESIYKIISEDTKVKTIIDDLDSRVNMPEQLPEICRIALKFGDEFEENVVNTQGEIVRLKYLNPKYIQRNEDAYGRLDPVAAFRQVDESNTTLATFYPWQVNHTRYNHERGNLYGTSFLMGSRRPWRQLGMMDDSVCIRRLTRSQKRYAFYFPVPKNMQKEEKKLYMQEQMNMLKRKRVTDFDGKLDYRRNPFAEEEDVFIPLEEGRENAARVDMFDPGSMSDNMLDVKYFQEKTLIPTLVPRAYMGLDEGVRTRATLGWQDIEFARILRSIQTMMIGFQRRTYNLQLLLMGVDPFTSEYRIVYPPISFVDEQMKASVENIRWQIMATARTQLGLPMDWLLRTILNVPEDDVAHILSTMDQPAPMTKPEASEELKIREAIFNNMRLRNELTDLRDKLRVVLTEKLHKPLAA